MTRRFFIPLLAALLASGASAAQERPAPLPADLAAVPGDALGFVHIKLADIWKSDSLKEFRETLLKAGEKALQGFDQRFLPHPSSIDKLTVVVVAQDGKLEREPLVYALLSTKEAVEKAAFLKTAIPDAVEQKAKFGKYYSDPKKQIAVGFISDKVMVVGPTNAVADYYAHQARPEGPLSASLVQANSKKHLFAAVNTAALPAQALEGAPPMFRPLLKVKVVTLALDVVSDLQIDAGLAYGDDEEAKAALAAVRTLAALGREEMKAARKEMLAKVLGDGKVAPIEQLPEAAMSLFALGSIENADEMLANPPIKLQGKALHASLKVPAGGGVVALSAVGVGLLLPAVQKVREAAARAQSSNNLKQIGLAILNYESAYGKLPSAAICDKNGKPLLSWRVAILPFIEQANLYNQFKLDEPWDSEHNIKLAEVVVKTYVHPQQDKDTWKLSHYRLFYGKDAMFDLKDGRTIAQVADGLSNTIMVVEAAQGVTWTKPDDFAYDAKKPLPKFGTFNPSGFMALMGDGSVQLIPNSCSEKTLRALITANGGEAIDFDDIDRPLKKDFKFAPKLPTPGKEPLKAPGKE